MFLIYPIRIGKDDTPAPSPGADALGARTMEDLFGDSITLTDFNHTHNTSVYLSKGSIPVVFKVQIFSSMMQLVLVAWKLI